LSGRPKEHYQHVARFNELKTTKNSKAFAHIEMGANITRRSSSASMRVSIGTRIAFPRANKSDERVAPHETLQCRRLIVADKSPIESRVGINLAKRLLQIHGIDVEGKAVVARKPEARRCWRSSPSSRRVWWRRSLWS
jgi:hypothetical protein